MTHARRHPHPHPHEAGAGDQGDPHPRARPTSHRRAARHVALGLLVTGWLGATAPALAAESCSVKSSRHATTVVELYTSEGCNSCPPADRWLSRLKADPQAIALAFHVDYWDRLGWQDRFASPAYTQRQAEQQAVNGARFSYTPQVVVDGVDRKDWPSIATPLASRQAVAPVELTLSRDGRRVTATVAASAATPKRLAAYWAATEQDHATAVKAGENQGATLQHDYVVRDYRPVAAWPAHAESPQTFVYDLPAAADAAHRRDVNLVVVDATTGRPLQAVRLGC